DELCVTPSAVSQQIRALEEILDIRLFRRMTRKVELTREGTALANAVQESLVLISQTCARLQDPRSPKVICVSATPSLATRWLVPRLGDFMSANPHVKITLMASNEAVDFERQDIDVAIRWGGGDWP